MSNQLIPKQPTDIPSQMVHRQARDARMLDGVLDTPRQQIQEHEFAKTYLPMMLADPSKVGPVNIDNWLRVAKMPHHEVDVYNGSEFMFTVPPLLGNAVPITAAQDRAHSMHSLVVAWKAFEGRSAAMGQQFFQQQIMPRIRSQPNPRYVQMWNVIRKRYNLPLIGNIIDVDAPARIGAQPIVEDSEL